MIRIVSRPFDARVAEKLAEKGYLPPIARALAARGITDIGEMAQDWRSLIPPSVLEGTKEAAERLALARERGEQVTIVADYDCDGATACVIGLKGLCSMGIRANYFVPNRVIHGYGLSPDVVDIIAARENAPDLILTVDNGVSSAAAVERAKALGIDVVVTDHHLPGPVLPDAVCIVNPNLKTSVFPSKSLAGCGVMYYVLLALRALLREKGAYTTETQPRLDTLIDLVALGTVADVVKLDKNNRILVYQGLRRIRAGYAQPGLKALFSVAGKDIHKACTRDFGFTIGPRINAAGRLDTMENGIECLLAEDPAEALEYAKSLNSFNSARQELETEMQEAAETALAEIDIEKRVSLTLFNECFNEGVVGLVASRLKEKTNRPVIVFAPSEEGMLKGSGRSIPGIHLRDALDLVNKRLPGSILRFGGHAMAAGLTLRPESLGAFREELEKVIGETADEDVFQRTILTDGGLLPEEITENLVTAVDNQIWGQGFDAPLFSNEFTVIRQSLVKGAHLKLILELDGKRFDAIYFRHAQALPTKIKLAYRPNINEFMGRRSLQLIIEASEETPT